jgi:hypothetical protein
VDEEKLKKATDQVVAMSAQVMTGTDGNASSLSTAIDKAWTIRQMHDTRWHHVTYLSQHEGGK